ncbi:MAG: hypothetical protein COA88_14550 [Kordia sp.]|nr:MAG: hypothetical protein COA88_14550 [Kordia sp.]
MNELNEEQQNKINTFLKSLSTDIDMVYHIDTDEIDFEDAFNSIGDQLEESGAFNIDIIYYSKAMEYLLENDASLSESTELAAEMGCTTENINSELLASLHASHYARENFQDLEEQISTFFNEMNDELQDV